MDLREYIKTYYIDKIKNVRDNVKIRDVNLTCEKNKHQHLLNITYTSRNVTESHQLLFLITMLNATIEHNFLKNNRGSYDLIYLSKHNYSTRGHLDLIGLKNMNIIKERVLLSNKCIQLNYNYENIDPIVQKYAKQMIIPLDIYIKTFFDLLPLSHKTSSYISQSPIPSLFDSTSSSSAQLSASSSNAQVPPQSIHSVTSVRQATPSSTSRYNDSSAKNSPPLPPP